MVVGRVVVFVERFEGGWKNGVLLSSVKFYDV